MSRQWPMFVAIALISAALASAVTWLLTRSPQAPPQQEKPSPAAPKPETVTFGGKVEASELTSVPVPVSGVMDQLLVTVGQEVMAGQTIARINSSALETNREAARLDLERLKERIDNLEKSLPSARQEATRARTSARRAEAEFEASKKTLDRQRLLLAEGATARLSFEAAEKDFQKNQVESSSLSQLAGNAERRVQNILEEIEQARRIAQDRSADLERMEVRMASGEIQSPADGWVAAIQAQPGEVVNSSGPDLFQIALSLAILQVKVHPDPAALARITPGMPVTVSLFEVPGATYSGRVREIQEQTVLVEFQNVNQTARPGHTADVRFTLP